MSPSSKPTALDPVRDVDVAHQGDQAPTAAARPGRRLGSAPGASSAAARRCRSGDGVEGEPERLGRRQRHGHAVRHHRLVRGVVLGVEVLDPSRDRVGVGVRDVHARVAEAHARERGGQGHMPRASSSSPWCTAVRKDSREQAQRLLGPHVRDRVGAAVGHPLLGPLALVRRVGPRGVALEGVAQDVHACGGGHPGGLGQRERGVDDGQSGPQPGVADARLDLQRRARPSRRSSCSRSRCRWSSARRRAA